jgi:hypothetical protein
LRFWAASAGVLHQGKQRLDELERLPDGLVHLPVGGEDRSAHV